MQHAYFMKEAIKEAKRGLYSTSPNPRVGCVIVQENQIIGRGAHLRAGEPHAEVYALREAGKNAKGATAYVTLEPCAHFGRTPPCARALVAAEVKRVVIGMTDPFSKVAGKGIQILKDAGIEVIVNVESESVKELNRGYLNRIETGKPWVRLKMASSFDGRTAMLNGESKWLTGEEARKDVQHWRALSCAVVTTAATVIADNARLTVRDADLLASHTVKQPLRILLDRKLRVPLDVDFFQNPESIVLITSENTNASLRKYESLGIDVIQVPETANGYLNVSDLINILGQKELNEILIEAGNTLAGEFISQNLVDEYILFIAPTFLGVNSKPLAEFSLSEFSNRHNYKVLESTVIGQDIRVIARK